MNYEPNTVQWGVGDLVLHDADAKRPDMLMVVIGTYTDGDVLTRYLINNLPSKSYVNPIDCLHDPALFNIDVVPYRLLVR